jgi:anti-sigma B factor antagonist
MTNFTLSPFPLTFKRVRSDFFVSGRICTSLICWFIDYSLGNNSINEDRHDGRPRRWLLLWDIPVMMTIGIHYNGTIAVLDLKGKFIKGQGGHQLQILIDKVLTAGTNKVLLNLTDVPIIDSMGIGEIVRAYTKVHGAGGVLKLVGLTDRVYGALRITQLLDLIESHKTEEEAVGSFGKEKKGRPRKKDKDKDKEKDKDSESD